MTNLRDNELQCIRVQHEGYEDTYISYKTFVKSFVEERWTKERRTNKQYTIFGYVHTKTTVTFDKNTKSVRTFIFPNSIMEARQLHLQNTQGVA